MKAQEEYITYWRAANKAISLGDESGLKAILAENLRAQLRKLEGDDNEEVSDERAVDDRTRGAGDAAGGSDGEVSEGDQ